MKDDKGWSPYVAGALAGVLLVLSLWVSGKFAGASTSFVRTAGMIEDVVAPEHVKNNAYLQSKKPEIDWQWMFVIGIFAGAVISSLTSRSFRFESTPPMWRARFGAGVAFRGVVAFVGGLVAMFGARLAGGCPSGHGLSGVMQFAVGSLIAAACFFIGGIVVARMLYAKGGPTP